MSAPRLGKKARSPESRTRRALRRKAMKKKKKEMLFTSQVTGETFTSSQYLDKIRKEYGDGQQ